MTAQRAIRSIDRFLLLPRPPSQKHAPQNHDPAKEVHLNLHRSTRDTCATRTPMSTPTQRIREMFRPVVAAALTAWIALPAIAQTSNPPAGQAINTTVDHSTVVTSAVTTLVPAAGPLQRSILRFQLGTSGATLWCRYDGLAPGISALGSFAYTGLGAGEDFEGPGAWIPQGAIRCLSDGINLNVTIVSAPQ